MAGRRAKRFRATRTIPVGFIASNARFTGHLVDISKTGLLMRCSHSLALGTVGRIGIALAQETVRIVAVVRRHVPSVGIAFEFVQMSARDRELLHRLLLRLEHPIGS